MLSLIKKLLPNKEPDQVKVAREVLDFINSYEQIRRRVRFFGGFDIGPPMIPIIEHIDKCLKIIKEYETKKEK